jgi:hypothetical protein
MDERSDAYLRAAGREERRAVRERQRLREMPCIRRDETGRFIIQI